MNYPQQTRSIKFGRYIKLGVVIIIVLFLSGTRISYSLSSLLQKIARPIWNIALPSDEEDVLPKLSLEDIRIKALGAEIDRLKVLLGRDASGGGRLLAAVVSPEILSFYDTFWIDVGATDGVEQGDLVVGGESVALGKVVEIFPDISKVQLFSAYGSETVARVADMEILVKGVGSQNFVLNIPKDLEIKEGDVVVYPGLDLLILGIVGRVETSANDPLARIFIRNPLNIQNLSRVYVIK